jgi:hypothetical protein
MVVDTITIQVLTAFYKRKWQGFIHQKVHNWVMGGLTLC